MWRSRKSSDSRRRRRVTAPTTAAMNAASEAPCLSLPTVSARVFGKRAVKAARRAIFTRHTALSHESSFLRAQSCHAAPPAAAPTSRRAALQVAMSSPMPSKPRLRSSASAAGSAGSSAVKRSLSGTPGTELCSRAMASRPSGAVASSDDGAPLCSPSIAPDPHGPARPPPTRPRRLGRGPELDSIPTPRRSRVRLEDDQVLRARGVRSNLRRI